MPPTLELLPPSLHSSPVGCIITPPTPSAPAPSCPPLHSSLDPLTGCCNSAVMLPALSRNVISSFSEMSPTAFGKDTRAVAQCCSDGLSDSGWHPGPAWSRAGVCRCCYLPSRGRPAARLVLVFWSLNVRVRQQLVLSFQAHLPTDCKPPPSESPHCIPVHV